MASTSLADQLDDAIEMMIAEPDSASPKVGLKIGELLGIAAELRLLPDPAFRSTLKAELLGQNHSAPVAAHVGIRRQATEQGQARRDAKLDEILPTLFGADYATYPVHRGNFRDFSGDPRGADCGRSDSGTLGDEANATHTSRD